VARIHGGVKRLQTGGTPLAISRWAMVVAGGQQAVRGYRVPGTIWAATDSANASADANCGKGRESHEYRSCYAQ
jgi:hypothetical protein